MDPKLLGEMTVSMLPGRGGLPAQGDPEADRLARHGAASRRHRSALHAADRFAKPLKTGAESTVVCTLQGEDLFLEGLKEPWRTECSASDPVEPAATWTASSPSALTMRAS